MEDKNLIVNIVREAGRIIADGWQKEIAVCFKGEINPVTEIDQNVESYITRKLAEYFPGYGILTEESAEMPGKLDARWILDPMDGTTNFTKRYPFVAISLALEKAGELIFGVVYNPVLEDMFIAEKGQGASHNGRLLHVNETADLKEAVLGSGFPYDAWVNPDNNTAQWAKLIGRCQTLRCDGSAALDLCRVACGQFDGFWEKGLSPWDVAAGAVIVREAGGVVSDYAGGMDFFARREIVAANTVLHQKIMDAITVGD